VIVGYLAMQLGDFDRAEAHLVVAVEIEEALDPESEQAALALGNLAAVQFHTGRLEEALAGYRRVVRLRADVDATSAELGADLASLGMVLARLVT
jgi:tetratricopeptide (TPR) repeat protein